MGAGSSPEAVVEAVDTQTRVVPTDAPEADGTLAWDSTTMVLVQARSGGVVGTGWTYGPAACASVVDDMLAPVVRGRSALDVPGRSRPWCAASAMPCAPVSPDTPSPRSTSRCGT